MADIGVIYHSGFGHTEKQAQSIITGLKSVNKINAKLIPVAQACESMEELQKLDGMLFGAPTYMGSVSAEFKRFMDDSSSQWMTHAWKNKVAGGFTNSGSMSGDKFNAQIQLFTFAAQHGMIWVSLGLKDASSEADRATGNANAVNRFGASIGALAQSENTSPDLSPNGGDLETAELYGERFAHAVLQWKNN